MSPELIGLEGGYRRRKISNRLERKFVLIVCAGKTEEAYFQSFPSRNRQYDVKVRICHPTDPLNIVRSTIGCMEHEGFNVENGDFAYCVFDIDQNTESNFQEARKLAASKGVILCPSNPCFEVWYLLHFSRLSARLTASEALEQAKKRIPGYEKAKDYSGLVREKRKTAIANAKLLAKGHNEDTPSTQIYLLVEKLLEILDG